MKSFLLPLLLAVSAPTFAVAANPLTPGERTVCRSLNHCLEILDAHPIDSFDYAVLAREFQRFGAKGQRSLVRRVRESGTAAPHAADLLALTRSETALGALQAAATETSSQLLSRTIAALSRRLTVAPSNISPPSFPRTVQHAPICANGAPTPFEARRREMPFFELDTAAPDAFGAYRPSATYDAPLRFATRGWLRSARPIPGGWLAAYPDGIIQFDNRTGAPRLRAKGNVLSLQTRGQNTMSPETWVFILNAQNQTYIIDMGTTDLKLVATLPGPLKELRRDATGTLYATSDVGQSVTLRTDGSIAAGCGPETP